MKQVAWIASCLLLAACQTAGPLDENSPFHILPAGSRLLLKQEITIPARSAGVTLQGGRVMNERALMDGRIKQYNPHCRLEVTDVHTTTQSVTADEFVVRRVRQEDRRVAAPGLMKAGLRNAGGTGFHVFRTVMELESTRQPQVRWLTCQQWGEPAHGYHVSIREIRQALGDSFELQIPVSVPSPAT